MTRPIGIRRELWLEIKALLDKTGLPWHFENATRHYQIYLAGRRIAVMSKDAATGRDSRQLQSAIRRRMRELSAGEDPVNNGRAVQGARI